MGRRRAFATAASRAHAYAASRHSGVHTRVLRRNNTQISASMAGATFQPAAATGTATAMEPPATAQDQVEARVTLEDGRSVTHVAHHRLISIKSQLTDFVTRALVSTLASFRPTWWANEHVQVVFTFIVPQPKVHYEREILPLKDGGQASLDWAMHSVDPYAPFAWLKRVFKSAAVKELDVDSLDDDAPIALVLHGLTGCSHSMQYLCADALKRGYRPVVFNKRGHGGVPLTTPRFQVFGNIDDLDEALTMIKSKFPRAQIYSIGSSAGASLLTSYLGQTGNKSRIEAGVLISPGYNTYEIFVHDAIKSPYSFLMSLTMKQLLWRNYQQLKDVVDYPRLFWKARSVSQVERQVCAQVHGEQDLEKFWKRNEPMHTRHLIRRPIMLINALDDPICRQETIEYDIVKAIPQSILMLTKTGGHCGFYENAWVDQPFSARACFAYFDSIRAFNSQHLVSAQEKNKVDDEEPEKETSS